MCSSHDAFKVWPSDRLLGAYWQFWDISHASISVSQILPRSLSSRRLVSGRRTGRSSAASRVRWAAYPRGGPRRWLLCAAATFQWRRGSELGEGFGMIISRGGTRERAAPHLPLRPRSPAAWAQRSKPRLGPRPRSATRTSPARPAASNLSLYSPEGRCGAAGLM